MQQEHQPEKESKAKEKEADGSLETSSASSLEENKQSTENQQVEVYKKEQDNLPDVVNAQSIINYPLEQLNTPNQFYQLATMLVGGKLCPLKNPSDVMIQLMAGKELGISLTSSLANIYPIEGKASLGIHLQRGVLLKNGVSFIRTRNAEAYYEFVIMKESKGEDGKIIKKPVTVGNGFIDEQPEGTKKKSIDVKTIYEFTRYLKVTGGKIVEQKAVGEFSHSEALSAGLLDKANWQKYYKDMLASRAFSRGAKEIADDLLHGMYSISELADINDSVDYIIEDGEEKVRYKE